MNENAPTARSAITRWLERAPAPLFIAYAGLAGFSTYFCMYAFRRPFTAVTYEGLELWGLSLKTVLVISQIIGYMLSKYIGVKFCSEVRDSRRFAALVALILSAELTLLGFAVAPAERKPIALFFNGLSLGMVWGICVRYVEGRRATEILLVGLCCSYILASGVVKDAGLYLMGTWRLDPFWMPAVTGAVFLPAFVVFAWLLDKLPPPNARDAAARTSRRTMQKGERRAFLRYFAVGVVVQLAVYMAITAFRDFRDMYGIELWRSMGLDTEPAIFTRAEMWVALAALLTLVALRCFDSKRWGVLPNLLFMMLGLAVVGTTTLLYERGVVSGFAWMVWIGVGGLLAYVASDTIFYERVIAASGWTGTAVFMAYVMDAGGYTSSVALLLFKEFAGVELSYLEFFARFCYALSVGGVLLLAISVVYFPSRSRRRRAELAAAADERIAHGTA